MPEQTVRRWRDEWENVDNAPEIIRVRTKSGRVGTDDDLERDLGREVLHAASEVVETFDGQSLSAIERTLGRKVITTALTKVALIGATA